jgi:hypothetical protein
MSIGISLKWLITGSILIHAAMMGEAQNLISHQWKERILVLQDYSDQETQLKSQLNLISRDIPGLLERKFVIYQVINSGYAEGLEHGELWSPWKEEGFPVCRQGDINFCVQIVGLDGELKWTSYEVTSLEEIFKVVDAMPMRNAELQRKKKKQKG